MKMLKFHKTFIILTLMVGIALMVTSCNPVYVHGDYGNRRPNYGYGYGRPHRYARPVVIVPRYCPPPRRGYYGGGNGRGNGRGRRW